MIHRVFALLSGATLFWPLSALAHGRDYASGPGFANTTQEVSFGVGHGCSGTDTYSVRIEIPAGVTSVRPETSDFGKTTVKKIRRGRSRR